MSLKKIKLSEDAEFVFQPQEGGLAVTVIGRFERVTFHITREQANSLGDVFKVFANRKAA